jgi:hypothetical protein
MANRHQARDAVRRKYYTNYIPQAALQKPSANIHTNKTGVLSGQKTTDQAIGDINDPGYTMSHRSSSAQQNWSPVNLMSS